MRPADEQEAQRLYAALSKFEATTPLLGLCRPVRREVLVEHLLSSWRNMRYIEYLTNAELSDAGADPQSPAFDPIKAAILASRRGDHDEACWLAFLSVHFGKHRLGGWRYVSSCYGSLGGERWTWEATRGDVTAFRQWLQENGHLFKSPSEPGGFGNHRKYESLGGWSEAGTGAVVASYVAWIDKFGTHEDAFRELGSGRVSAERAFDNAYRSVRSVHRFGRTARFDYLTLISRLGLAQMRPGRPYLVQATGPLLGARLLLTGDKHASTDAVTLETQLAALNAHLGVDFGVLEDALCNWQKSPSVFRRFRG